MLIIRLVDIAFQIFFIMLLARIVASWVPELMRYRAFVWIATYTNPYLNWFRRIIPPLGMLDLSPIVAFFALTIIHRIVIYLLIALWF